MWNKSNIRLFSGPPFTSYIRIRETIENEHLCTRRNISIGIKEVFSVGGSDA